MSATRGRAPASGHAVSMGQHRRRPTGPSSPTASHTNQPSPARLGACPPELTLRHGPRGPSTARRGGKPYTEPTQDKKAAARLPSRPLTPSSNSQFQPDSTVPTSLKSQGDTQHSIPQFLAQCSTCRKQLLVPRHHVLSTGIPSPRS